MLFDGPAVLAGVVGVPAAGCSLSLSLAGVVAVDVAVVEDEVCVDAFKLLGDVSMMNCSGKHLPKKMSMSSTLRHTNEEAFGWIEMAMLLTPSEAVPFFEDDDDDAGVPGAALGFRFNVKTLVFVPKAPSSVIESHEMEGLCTTNLTQIIELTIVGRTQISAKKLT